MAHHRPLDILYFQTISDNDLSDRIVQICIPWVKSFGEASIRGALMTRTFLRSVRIDKSRWDSIEGMVRKKLTHIIDGEDK